MSTPPPTPDGSPPGEAPAQDVLPGAPGVADEPAAAPPAHFDPAHAQPIPPAYPPQPSYPTQQHYPVGYPQYAAPGYPQPGYRPTPPGYPVYQPQPGYPPQGFGPPGFPPQAGYQPGYPPQPSYVAPVPQPGYVPGPAPSAPLVSIDLKPGIIPLRPLGISDIYNGAVAYIRSNPRTTLGLTTIVVVLTQLLALGLQIGPLLALDRVNMLGDNSSDVGASALLQLPGALTTWLATILLGGMLTVVVGRAVFGETITIGEAWARIRGRLPALIGLAALETLAMFLVLGVIVVIVVGLAQASAALAVIAGLFLLLLFGLGACYLWVQLTFAPTAIVLERLSVMAAIRRSFALVRGDFWRLLGILLLTAILVSIIASALGFPFQIAGAIMTSGVRDNDVLLIGASLTAIGAAIGRIITTPFSAGVTVLLYTDRRMRGEAFDMVLRTGADAALRAAADPAAGPHVLDETDQLWLTRR
ncbi:MAG: glycerophosphoryl diester phosphodiesterase membrane domain-containing protein [Mycolicibacterium sp.]|uniref:DUF3824 domain-containing protein n=1 Tax=Mycolicibacterium insubricum TaxID=444597 RepID=UPI0013D4D09F|nr:glycerophosphoryl diester phosphodiesterase membrane domain-containing protein [Mycolicibacterium insubricum]MCB9439179.1 glycerophosphoryl diester phosphodiesterase membrane domain-containing protein [Mycolicibacterium sp.]MCV7082939.1 glycerophosphoryl diester phosphodiesterase membrane domain-containing protein [Mycolicibacterium insubricum]